LNGGNFSKLMKLKLTVVFATLAASCAWSQAAAPSGTKTAGARSDSLPKDPVALVQAVRTSTYHPDGLMLIECDARVDWMAALKGVSASASDLRPLTGLLVHVRSVRDQPAVVSFDWQGGVVSEQAHTEKTIKQILAGFFTGYWRWVASPLLDGETRPERVDSLPDGSVRLWSAQRGRQTELLVNADGTPLQFSEAAGADKAAVDFSYKATPHPGPGDLRRITGVMLDLERGASSVKLEWTLDYQDVNGFSIPKNVTAGAWGGSKRFAAELTGCRAATFAVSQ
jgi:hypothetical protein